MHIASVAAIYNSQSTGNRVAATTPLPLYMCGIETVELGDAFISFIEENMLFYSV